MDLEAHHRSMTAATLRSTLETLAAGIAADGVCAHDSSLVALARQASMAGLAPVAAGVLGDHTAPTVVRERAFGFVARALLVAADRPVADVIALDLDVDAVERQLVAC
jgi:hypothetical protein